MPKTKSAPEGFTDYTVWCDGKPKFTHSDIDVCKAKRASLIAENPARNVTIVERVVGDKHDSDSVDYQEVN